MHTPTPKLDRRLPTADEPPPPRFIADLVAPLPFEVRGDMRARVIWTLFRERGMAWVPVVDEAGHPIGLLLRADLAAAFNCDRWPSLVDADDDEPIVADVMRREVRVVRASAPVAEARALLESSHVPEVIVVDHRGVMLGTVSRETLAPPPPRFGGH